MRGGGGGGGARSTGRRERGGEEEGSAVGGESTTGPTVLKRGQRRLGRRHDERRVVMTKARRTGGELATARWCRCGLLLGCCSCRAGWILRSTALSGCLASVCARAASWGLTPSQAKLRRAGHQSLASRLLRRPGCWGVRGRGGRAWGSTSRLSLSHCLAVWGGAPSRRNLLGWSCQPRAHPARPFRATGRFAYRGRGLAAAVPQPLPTPDAQKNRRRGTELQRPSRVLIVDVPRVEEGGRADGRGRWMMAIFLHSGRFLPARPVVEAAVASQQTATCVPPAMCVTPRASRVGAGTLAARAARRTTERRGRSPASGTAINAIISGGPCQRRGFIGRAASQWTRATPSPSPNKPKPHGSCPIRPIMAHRAPMAHRPSPIVTRIIRCRRPGRRKQARPGQALTHLSHVKYSY